MRSSVAVVTSAATFERKCLQIKFRAWDKATNMMTFPPYVHQFNAPDLVAMQFTGLYDKNGKEIYEGDIVHYRDDGAVVEISGVKKKCAIGLALSNR